tara:strand:+ start:3819 stop:4829 length:1011 start_codon:yes stop_codon:yes gene_type:complete
MKKLNVGVLGCSGYTGIELLKILDIHPNVKLIFLGSNSKIGIKAEVLHSGFKNINKKIVRNNSLISKVKDLDVLFSCLPNGELAKNFKNFTSNKKIKIIDLSGDFRLPNSLNKKWYKTKRNDDLFKTFQYILPELNQKKINKNRNISNPGCYATSIILGIAPIISSLNKQSILIDTKSGISGAGKNNNIDYIFNEANENLSIYNEGNHRHMPEIENFIAKNYKKTFKIIMIPHLLPLTRGILSNIYVDLNQEITEDKVLEKYINFYKNNTFIKISNKIPSIKDAVRTNNCLIGIRKFKNTKTLMVTSVIDNLIKGASGQAVQNMNLLFNLDEELGL